MWAARLYFMSLCGHNLWLFDVKVLDCSRTVKCRHTSIWTQISHASTFILRHVMCNSTSLELDQLHKNSLTIFAYSQKHYNVIFTWLYHILKVLKCSFKFAKTHLCTCLWLYLKLYFKCFTLNHNASEDISFVRECNVTQLLNLFIEPHRSGIFEADNQYLRVVKSDSDIYVDIRLLT